MKRPQWTLTLLLTLVAWALSAMPAPQARADARDVIAARACGWLDVEDRSLNGADRAEEPIATPNAAPANTLRFRLVPAETPQPAPRPAAPAPLAAPGLVAAPPAPAPRVTSEALLSLREPAASVDDPAEPIVWLVPMPSRWAQRRTVEMAAQLAYRVSWSWGLPTARPARPAGIGRLAAEAASPWLGDRCPVVMRVRPADSGPATVDRPARRDAATTLAAAMSGLAALLQDWSARIEQVAQQQATPSRPPRPGASHEDFDWTQAARGQMILGL